MKTSFISTQNISHSMRYQMTRMQVELNKLEKEMVTQRVADTGLHLGAQTGRSISLERDIERLKGIIDTNGLAASRLKSTQEGMSAISSAASSLLSTLNAAAAGSVEPQVTRTEALGAITSMTSILNTSFNGEYIFAGVNTDVKPITDFSAGSASRTAIETAFATHFGFAHTDAAAAGLTGADITDFLTNVLEPQFMADWGANWSSATDQAIVSRITLNDTETTSVSANSDGIKQMALAASVIGVLFEGQIGDSALTKVALYGVEKMGQATSSLAHTQAATGISEQRIAAASERLQMQVDIFKGNVSDLVGIDPYEVSNRVSTLLAQIETSYTLTARIRQLSLVKYLP
ncbi:MAG TPA: flagellar hook-associated family protein [Rhizobiaceae bacterium]|nr:flagellar hook-associated family protein [Rhizobiaceae bacterium]